ncbi:(2Fe-2S)-binding protein [Moritella viscosa]
MFNSNWRGWMERYVKNPMFGCYRLKRIAGKPVQIRRNCCLRYRLPMTELCDDCPRLLEPK